MLAYLGRQRLKVTVKAIGYAAVHEKKESSHQFVPLAILSLALTFTGDLQHLPHHAETIETCGGQL